MLTSVAVVGAALLAVPAAQAADPAHVPIWDNGPGGERYVAMGDSFASGPGIDPMRPECMRSTRNFPTLVARGLDVRAYTDASCGGARLRDLWAPQTLQGYTNAAQLEAVQPDTTLVTLGTIGGNDVGLVQLASECLGTASCVNTSPDNPYLQRIEGTRAPLAQAIRDIEAKASGADVVVVGYSTYLPPQGCAMLASLLSPEEAGYFQGLVDKLSDVMEQTAAAEGALFADLRDIPGAIDHTACAPVEHQWIRALGVPGDGVNFHPSSAGMAQMGWMVESVVRRERGLPAVPQPAVPPLPTPVPAPAPTPPAAATPTPAPQPGATKAEVRAQLVAALRDARLTARCTWTDTKSAAGRARTVRMRVRGGHGLLERVEFRLGTRTLGSQRKAPFTLERRAARLRALGEPTDWRLHRRMRARLTVSSGDLELHRTLAVRRPDCLR